MNAKSGPIGPFRQTAYGVNGLRFFRHRQKIFSPFLLVGTGANNQSPSGMVPVGNTGSSTRTYGTAGVGFLTSLWKWGGAIRVGVQDLHTFGNGNYNDAIASIGLQIPLGSAGGSCRIGSGCRPRRSSAAPAGGAGCSAPQESANCPA